MKFRPGLSRAEKNNAVDGWMNRRMTVAEQQHWENCFAEVPVRLTDEEAEELQHVSYASDAYLPFRDNIDRAAGSGVTYIAQPGNSAHDAQVIRAADEYRMAMAFTSLRLFHHS